MADTTKNTSDTGSTHSTPASTSAGSTPGAMGGKTPDRQGGQATAARTAREQSPGGENRQSSFMNEVNRGTQRGSEMIDQARENFGEAYDRASEMYDRASQSVSEGWDQAMEYGRKNPGTATLIAFGAGVGVGLLIASGMNTRSRSQRLVPPVMNALSEIAAELFR